MKGLRDRTEIMTQKAVDKALRQKTFLTAGGLKMTEDQMEAEKEKLRNKRFEEAKTKNKTF